MLSIKQTQPGLFEALAGGERLGWCRCEARGDTTAITGASLADGTDAALLDGLIRAALFAGLGAGREYGEIEEGVRRSYAPLFERLALPEGRVKIQSLAGCCGGPEKEG